MVGLFRSTGLLARSYASVRDVLDAVRPDQPGCIILDERLPDRSGLVPRGRLHGLGIRTPTIFMSGHGGIPISARAMQAGAVEFLLKSFRDQAMLDA